MEGNLGYHIPSTSADWGTDTLPVSRSSTSSGSAQKSTAIIPSTAQEWNVQRSLITRLYGDMNLRLKDVQRIMETDYNFKATKRMYNTRLKQWKICKNYRAAEKELLAARIAEAHLENRPVSDLTFKDRPVKLDRVLRHLRTKKRANSGFKKATKRRAKVIAEDESSSESSTSAAAQDEMVRLPSIPVHRPNTITPDSGTTTSTVLTPPSESDESEDSFEIIEREDAIPDLPYPAATMSSPKGVINTQLILHQTQVYYRHRIGSAEMEIIDPQHCTVSFWRNIKTGIYFLKKQCPDLAWPLLNDACVLAPDMFSQTPLLFLNDVLTVLSPVNTSVYPQVRSIILKYLAAMATIKFKSSQHPLVVLLRELSSDNQHGEASETALDLTLALFTQVLGPDHTATFAVHRSLISLLRRDKRLVMAKQQAERLVESCKQILFATQNFSASQVQKPSVSMTELCIALTELVHIHIDLEEYGLAKGICTSALRQYKLIQGVDFPNNRAAYAMEDMAEICTRTGEREEAADWLRQALYASSTIRGDHNPTTEHIRDKLHQVAKTPAPTLAPSERLASGSQAFEYHAQLLTEAGRAKAFEICPFMKGKLLADGKIA